MPSENSPAQSGSGSPSSGEPVYLAVGLLRRPHGVHGAMLMTVLTDFPERLMPGKRLYAGEQHEVVRLSAVRPHAEGLLVSLRGFDTPEAVGRLRNCYLYVEAAGLPPLPEGEYYHHELVGLEVVAEDGQVLGTLAEVMETGANDVYLVTDPAGHELLLPAIPPVILEVDLDRRRMRVHLLPGLRGEE